MLARVIVAGHELPVRHVGFLRGFVSVDAVVEGPADGQDRVRATVVLRGTDDSVICQWTDTVEWPEVPEGSVHVLALEAYFPSGERC